MAYVPSYKSRIFVGPLAWSGYVRGINESFDSAVLDTTTIADQDMTYIYGVNSGQVSLDMLLDGSGAAGSQFATLNTWRSTSQVVTIGVEGIAAGAPVWLIQADESNFTVNSAAEDVVSVAGAYMTDGLVGAGVVIDTLTAITVDGNGTAIDNGASTSNGGVGHLHITAFSGLTSTSVILEHSTDNVSFATLGTFTTATGTTSERITVTGTVNRYVRVRDDVTGTGSNTRIVSFARN